METAEITMRVGQKVLVQTRNYNIAGTLKYYDADRNVIELVDGYDHDTLDYYELPQIIAVRQITNIKILESETYSGEQTTENTPQNGTSAETKPDFSQNTLLEQLSLREMELARKQLNNIVYITQTDKEYSKALSDIHMQPAVALYMEPVDYGRVYRTSVMVIATYHKVYIFDIVNLGKIFRELKEILEGAWPRKVLHYGNRVGDHLRHRYHIKLKGVFDTFVAYSQVTKAEEPITLTQAVQKTLGIAPTYFQHEALRYDPFQRPLTSEVRVVFAKKAIFQLRLYEHLLHKYMLKDFYQQCEKFTETFTDSDVTAPLLMSADSRVGYEHIKLNSTDTPNVGLISLE